MQLTEWQARYEALGASVVAMTYDDVDVLADFAADRDIRYPLLSDKGGKNVTALGILNTQYAEGHPAYGIAHPGVFYVDADGVIRLKRAVEGYRERPSFEELHAALKALLAEDAGPAAEPAEAPTPLEPRP